MKKTTFLLIPVIFCLSIHNLLAQEQFAVIEKNVNLRAAGLFHDLNKTKDSLILRSDTKLSYVYSINKDHKRELNYYVDRKSCILPLTNLSKGKHVVVVGKSPKKIVFVIRVYGQTPAVASGFDE